MYVVAPLLTVCVCLLQSSIRHSLSLGSYFRKADANSSNQLFGKKGHFWEVVPDKQAMLDKEIASYFAQPHYDSTSLSTLPGKSAAHTHTH